MYEYILIYKHMLNYYLLEIFILCNFCYKNLRKIINKKNQFFFIFIHIIKLCQYKCRKKKEKLCLQNMRIYLHTVYLNIVCKPMKIF